ncbi:GxxExxY protein [Granulicella sp. WH15]|nr:GxxExxY protein [Granulicella sp. WH15]
MVEQKIILELKAADQILKIHEAQLLNYLRCSEMEIGLLLNFGPMPKFRRLEFCSERKHLACIRESEHVGATSNV